MSHRLKLNAVHFANSLEDEKSLLDTSTEVLGSKLDISYHWYLADNGRESSWNEGLEEASLDRIEQGKRYDVHDPRNRSASHDHFRLDIYAYTIYIVVMHISDGYTSWSLASL